MRPIASSRPLGFSFAAGVAMTSLLALGVFPAAGDRAGIGDAPSGATTTAAW